MLNIHDERVSETQKAATKSDENFLRVLLTEKNLSAKSINEERMQAPKLQANSI